MNFIKNYGTYLVGLLVALVILRLVLGASKKLPVVGGIVERAEDIAFD